MGIVLSLKEVFSNQKTIESKSLNRLGAQVFRSVAARAIFRLRGTPADLSPEDRLHAGRLQSDGMLLIPDFLPATNFKALRSECLGLARSHPAAYFRRSGPVSESRVAASALDPAAYPNLMAFLANPRLKAILDAAERRPAGDIVRFAKLEHLVVGEDDGTHDSQTDLHSDIFYTSHKVWFYLTDVRPETGPLTFIKGTHRLTPERLYYIYRHSIGMGQGVDPSRRVEASEAAKLPEETRVTCPANTLVIANTCGYHRRCPGVAGEDRQSIHLEVRQHPFKWSGR